MTIPSERTRAVLNTEQFLTSLLDPKKTPRVPTQVRRNALALLRHYPSSFDLELTNKLWLYAAVECPFGRIEE